MHTSWGEDVEQVELTLGPYTFDAYVTGPQDGELVLLLHGFPEFSDCWGTALPELAAAGYRAVAVDQRGYSPRARPEEISAYHLTALVEDVLGFADAFGARRFHLLAHDWGGLVAWAVAAHHPDRVISLSVLATPHPSALQEALNGDTDQAQRSRYVELFRAPDHAAEAALLADDAAPLRSVYQGVVPAQLVEANVRRLRAGALTGGLNWYRATEGTFKVDVPIVTVPTLYVWGMDDMALGQDAAMATRKYVESAYHFLPLHGATHWLPEADVEHYLPAVLEQLTR